LRRTRIAVWLVAATVVYAIVSRTVYGLAFLRHRARGSVPAACQTQESVAHKNS